MPPTPIANWKITFEKQWAAIRVLNGSLADTELKLELTDEILPNQFSVKTLTNGEQLTSTQITNEYLFDNGRTIIVPIQWGSTNYDEIQLMWRDEGEKIIFIKHLSYNMNGEWVSDQWGITAVNSAIVEVLN